MAKKKKSTTEEAFINPIDKDKVALTLSLRGASGESYHEIFYYDNVKPPVPKARLYDAAGRELEQLDFHYG